jgi:uncharacterized protein YdeI (YjbR/CyaY-like superfamily)
MEEKKGEPVLELGDADAWAEWLEENHDSVRGVWLKIAKKGTGATTVSYEQAVEGALCQGWIDGQSSSYDDTYWLQRYTPRGPRSKWSQINCGRVEQLTAAGRMRPAGQAAVDAAKGDGRWDAAYAPPSKATVPPDLQAALDANPAAADFFATLTGSNRFAVLYRIQDAKRPETRARRIETYVGMLARGERIRT